MALRLTQFGYRNPPKHRSSITSISGGLLANSYLVSLTSKTKKQIQTPTVNLDLAIKKSEQSLTFLTNVGRLTWESLQEKNIIFKFYRKVDF